MKKNQTRGYYVVAIALGLCFITMVMALVRWYGLPWLFVETREVTELPDNCEKVVICSCGALMLMNDNSPTRLYHSDGSYDILGNSEQLADVSGTSNHIVGITKQGDMPYWNISELSSPEGFIPINNAECICASNTKDDVAVITSDNAIAVFTLDFPNAPYIYNATTEIDYLDIFDKNAIIFSSSCDVTAVSINESGNEIVSHYTLPGKASSLSAKDGYAVVYGKRLYLNEGKQLSGKDTREVKRISCGLLSVLLTDDGQIYTEGFPDEYLGGINGFFKAYDRNTLKRVASIHGADDISISENKIWFIKDNTVYIVEK